MKPSWRNIAEAGHEEDLVPGRTILPAPLSLPGRNRDDMNGLYYCYHNHCTIMRYHTKYNRSTSVGALSHGGYVGLAPASKAAQAVSSRTGPWLLGVISSVLLWLG